LNLFLAKQCLNPTVKAINHNIQQGLLDAVDRAKRKRLERVILSDAGSCVVAGAMCSGVGQGMALIIEAYLRFCQPLLAI